MITHEWPQQMVSNELSQTNGLKEMVSNKWSLHKMALTSEPQANGLKKWSQTYGFKWILAENGIAQFLQTNAHMITWLCDYMII